MPVEDDERLDMEIRHAEIPTPELMEYDERFDPGVEPRRIYNTFKARTSGRREADRAQLVQKAAEGWIMPPRNAELGLADTISTLASAAGTQSTTVAGAAVVAEPSATPSPWVVEVLDVPAPLNEHYDDDGDMTPRRVHSSAAFYEESLGVTIPMWHNVDDEIAAVEAATKSLIESMSTKV